MLVVCIVAGCPRNEPALPIEEETGVAGELLSSVNVADPRAEEQLLEGFHDLEQLAWRWTEKRFSVALQPPEPVPGHRTALEATISIPPMIIESLGPVTLSASIDGTPVGSQTFSEAGQSLEFKQPVPDGVLSSLPVQAGFELDKAIEPSEQDTRQLGLIVSAVQLQ